MSQIGKYKIEKFLLNSILNGIENFIKILEEFEGKVFGEYVREVIVPRMKNPNCDVIFNFVDVWFQNQTKADDFIKLMSIDKTFYQEEISPSKNIDLRTFHEPKQYFLRDDERIKFNIIVHPSLPINNFDVNCLTYFYSDDKPVIETGFPEDKKEQIIEAIYKKEATMNKYYFFNMVNHRLTYPERSKMINELFENRGWVIIQDGIKFTSSFTGTFEDAKAKEKFINKTILERSKQKSMKIDKQIDKQIPNTLQWSRITADHAEDKHLFINVDSLGFSTRLLSTSIISWTSNDLNEQKRIFNLDCRITGTPKNVATTLKLHGLPDTHISKVLENSITKENYNCSKKIEYLEELERRKIYELKSLDKKEKLENSDDKRKRLNANFLSSDELFKKALINRNKAFFECISDFGITDKIYISNRIINYSEELSSKLIIDELISKKNI